VDEEEETMVVEGMANSAEETAEKAAAVGMGMMGVETVEQVAEAATEATVVGAEGTVAEMAEEDSTSVVDSSEPAANRNNNLTKNHSCIGRIPRTCYPKEGPSKIRSPCCIFQKSNSI
jgi:hypothetical protein